MCRPAVLCLVELLCWSNGGLRGQRFPLHERSESILVTALRPCSPGHMDFDAGNCCSVGRRASMSWDVHLEQWFLLISYIDKVQTNSCTHLIYHSCRMA